MISLLRKVALDIYICTVPSGPELLHVPIWAFAWTSHLSLAYGKVDDFLFPKERNIFKFWSFGVCCFKTKLSMLDKKKTTPRDSQLQGILTRISWG